MNLLVTGGAGYVGGAVARRLRAAGHAVTILDDLSTGHRKNVETFDFVEADMADRAAIEPLFQRRRIEGIVHMAALCLVGASVRDPEAYYDHNLRRPLVLLDLALRAGVGRFVFSSSAAVYGEPDTTPIEEDHPTRPTNPYGETKLAFERALAWHAAARGTVAVALRYFNAAGATDDGAHGEQHAEETHLVPNVLRAALGGAPIAIFGTDYPTPDGTAVRDYVHIEDLAEAHRLALEHAAPAGRLTVFNLGSGQGASVREVIDTARRVTGRPIPVVASARRPGDPARLVASHARAREGLGWRAARGDLAGILESAWRFARSVSGGR
ncbi:MAG TPA: UDP-glucose 4-epimerase GalE [Candidatus Polarisedimenticolia bacterium]|nr:UDP-glucose 4-epimerase GalE [Candidatus Polarisedimenticolia bacterium]